jgi:hypothetical protein
MPSQRDNALGRNVDICFCLWCSVRTVQALRDSEGRLTSTVSSSLTTPGYRSVRSFLRAFLARGSRALLAVMSKEKILQLEPSSCNAPHRQHMCSLRWVLRRARTFLVPLYSVQMDSSISTTSPKEYGNGGPEAMAEATADRKKSIAKARSGSSG